MFVAQLQHEGQHLAWKACQVATPQLHTPVSLQSLVFQTQHAAKCRTSNSGRISLPMTAEWSGRGCAEVPQADQGEEEPYQVAARCEEVEVNPASPLHVTTAPATWLLAPTHNKFGRYLQHRSSKLISPARSMVEHQLPRCILSLISHNCVLWATSTLWHSPLNVLQRVLDVAGLAM